MILFKGRELPDPKNLGGKSTQKRSVQSARACLEYPEGEIATSYASKRSASSLGLQGRELFRYLKHLRSKNLISRKFGKLVSKRTELAYSIYFKRSLPVTTIGKQAGIINFPSVIHNHKAAGWDVPTSLFKYDGDEIRSRLRKRRKK